MCSIVATKRLIVAVLALCALAAGCGRGETFDLGTPEENLCSVQHLKSLCTHTSVPITSALVIRGRVVANDLYGECNRALVIEDETGGIQVLIDQAHTSEYWPFGVWVRIYCNGLTLHSTGGRIELGYDPDMSGFGSIPYPRISLHLQRESLTAETAVLPEPRRVSIEELTPLDIDTYVRISNVRFQEQGCWCDLDPDDPSGKTYLTTERTVQDALGVELAVRTSGLSLYAGEKLPEGAVDLCGTVGYFSGAYSLRVINRGVYPATQ